MKKCVSCEEMYTEDYCNIDLCGEGSDLCHFCRCLICEQKAEDSGVEAPCDIEEGKSGQDADD